MKLFFPPPGLRPAGRGGTTFRRSASEYGNRDFTTHRATIGESVSSEKIYYKTSSSTSVSTHVGMIDGTDSTTFAFIIHIIDNDVDSFSAAELLQLYGISQS